MTNPPEKPVLRLGQNTQAAHTLEQLLLAAKTAFAKRQIRAAADALSAGALLAQQAGLHREAARFRKANAILSTGGRPKLLTKAAAPEDDGP